MISYLDQGTPTTDYNTDPSDIARMRAGLDISGQPKDPSLYPLDNYVNNPAAPTAWNQARAPYNPAPRAVTTAPSASNFYSLPGVTSQPTAIPALPSQGPTGNPQIDAFNQAQAARSAIATAQNPLDYSSPAALAASQRTRAAQVAGGTDLFSNLSGGNGPIVTSQDGTIASDLANSKKGSATLATNLVNDPRFRTLMATNPDNARRFYSAITGRGYDDDLAATQALQQTQNTNQLALDKDVAVKAIAATKDQPELGIKKGQIVKQVIQPGLIPGTVAVGEAPMTDLEMKAYQAGGTRRAFNMPSFTDTQTAELARKQHLEDKQAAGELPPYYGAAASPTGVPNNMDKLLAMGHNFATTVGSVLTDPSSVLTNTRDTDGYVSPQVVANSRAQQASDHAATVKRMRLEALGLQPAVSDVLDTSSGYTYSGGY